MAETVLVPGPRDVRASLDAGDADGCVVACPPHPGHGGSRSDARLTAVSAALAERGVACLRVDYGPWDGGRGERADARRSVAWARERYERAGLFGYSFGGAVALLAAAAAGEELAAASALAPVARLGDDPDLDAVAALGDIACPVQVCYGERDAAADWEPVVERAHGLGHEVVAVGADHFFVGRTGTVAERAAEFLAAHVR